MHLATSQTTQADICFKIYKENKFSITPGTGTVTVEVNILHTLPFQSVGSVKYCF